jgi:MoxR-like ATPase
LIQNVGRVLLGKERNIEHAVTALLAGRHLLIEDVPGVGKTLLARALARSLDLPFQRIQFTADLLPSDVIGVSVFAQNTGEFSFRKGPIFGGMILADELNRAPPRTQSALLQCMEEAHVSVDGLHFDLPQPFFVVATQNPLEFEGTYPLPESQLDRFLLRLEMGHPHRDAEREILRIHGGGSPMERVQPVATPDEWIAAQAAVERVRVDPSLEEYVLTLAETTRRAPTLRAGVSPRGTLALHRAARALALVRGRDYTLPDDVTELLLPCWAHRVLPKRRSARQPAEARAALEEILAEVPVPV